MTPTRSPRGHLQSIIRKVSVPAKYGDETSILRYLGSPAYRTALEGLAGDLDMVASAQASVDRALKRCRGKLVPLIDKVDLGSRTKVDWKSNPKAVARFIEMALAEPSHAKLARKTGLPENVVKMARRKLAKTVDATIATQGRLGMGYTAEARLAA